MKHVIAPIAALLLTLASACVTSHETRAPATPGRVPPDALVPGAFAADGSMAVALALSQCEEAGQTAWAAETAGRYAPEMIAALATSPNLSPQARAGVARALDRSRAGTGPAGAFYALARARSAEPGTFRAHDAAMKAIFAALRRGDLAAAAEELPVPLPADDPARLLEIEAAALDGFVRLRAGDAETAEEWLRRAADVALETGWSWHAARASLLVAELAEARGDAAAAESAWRDAVLAAAALLDAPAAVQDPFFWERATAARGAAAWPGEVLELLRRDARLPALDVPGSTLGEPGDVVVGLCAGEQRLRRGEGVPALLTFRQAEEQAQDDRARALAVVGQARALIALRRMSDARQLLVEHQEDEDEVVRAEAVAQLGAIELAEGRAERAAALLRPVLDVPGQAIPFPERSRALANFATALLATSRREEGAQRLADARAGFLADGDLEGLAQLLQTERDQARAVEQPGEAARLQAELDLVLRNGFAGG